MERPRTQAEVRREEFRRAADAANAIIELAFAEIDEALDRGEITLEQKERMDYEESCRLHHGEIDGTV